MSRPPIHPPIPVGHRIERLVVEGDGPPGHRGQKRLWCRCDCGTRVLVEPYDLRNRTYKSCGCLKRERIVKATLTHGETGKTPEYRAWQGMLARCYNPNVKAYHRYGGRGITVCDRWRRSFMAFLADLGRRPDSTHSLDRINNDGNYVPGNVRWATKRQQSANRRSNRLVTFQNETRPLIEWAEIVGIAYKTLHQRLRLGWSVRRTLTEPPRACRPVRRVLR